MSWVLIRFAAAVILTIFIEAIIIIPVFYRHSLSRRQLIINVILINAITNISLNLVLYMSGSLRTYLIIIGELIIPVIEGMMYKAGELKLGVKRIIGICYIANMASFIMGILLEGIV